MAHTKEKQRYQHLRGKDGKLTKRSDDSPNTGHGHHWFGNAESYFLIGDAMGRAMLPLLK